LAGVIEKQALAVFFVEARRTDANWAMTAERTRTAETKRK